MELTLESAFSLGGFIGHLSYLLLIISMLMRHLTPLRLFAIAAGLVAIVFEVYWLQNPVGAFWNALLVLVNVFMLALMAYQSSRARFSDEEHDFLSRMMPELDKIHARRLLNLGQWISGKKDLILTQEDSPVDNLIYLAEGEAVITHEGHAVARCLPKHFVGEMTVLSGQSATGTAQLTMDARYLAIEANALRALCKKHPEVKQALEASFSMNMRDKLVMSNRIAKQVVKEGV